MRLLPGEVPADLLARIPSSAGVTPIDPTSEEMTEEVVTHASEDEPENLDRITPFEADANGDPGVSRPGVTESQGGWARLPIPLKLPVSGQAAA
jgi:hypothetical protein